MQERTIIHLNVADFAVEIERLCDSRLREQPIVIANSKAQRATVYDMSEEAYQDGIRKGMPLHKARKICRAITVVEPHPDRYHRAMQTLAKFVTPYTPFFELTADDGHLFLDVTGTHRLFGPAMDVGWHLEKTIKKDMTLRPIWTVAPNKLVAKVASRIVKPIGEYIVGSGEEACFLAPHSLNLLPGIEPSDIQQFAELNISRIGEIAALSSQQLAVLFGKRSYYLHDLAHGVDPSPVLPPSPPQPVVSFIHTFSGSNNDRETIENTLYRLSEQIGTALRKKRLATCRLAIILHYTDGARIIRHAVTKQATAIDCSLFKLAKIALYRAWHRRTCVKSICLLGDRLTPPSPQLDLFPTVRTIREKKEKLCNALDIIRQHHSDDAIQIGRLLAA